MSLRHYILSGVIACGCLGQTAVLNADQTDNSWQWHAVGAAGNWAHSASYSAVSSAGASCPFASVVNANGVSYGGFIYPFDRRVMRVKDDFDGDGKTDNWFYYAPGQVWYLVYSSATQTVSRLAFGLPDAVAVPEDYDGDQLTDFAVYQESSSSGSSGAWFALLSSQGYASLVFGGPGWTAIPGDYDGDQKADPAVYSQAQGIWRIMMSTEGYNVVSDSYGGSGWTPLTGDYDEDDKTDPVVYNESLSAVAMLLSGSDYLPLSAGYGGPGWTLLTEDYDGDGCADLAAYGRASGLWFVINYKLEHIIWGNIWGGAGCQPLAGDYDGDGRADAAVFYRTRHDSIWYMNESTAGPQSISARNDRR